MKRYETYLRRMILAGFLLFIMSAVFAGGILTNTNQSAQFVRMMSRNASTQIDAVYFNPAGVMKLDNGFHLALHNQSIFQTRIINTTANLNNKEFIGEVSAPLFPTAFAVFKTDYLAFSFGFGPNGGGGSADFKEGLPSFEGKVAQIVPALKAQGYSADIAFKAQSVFWGIQGGISAKAGNVFAGYIGVRYLPSTNTYAGHIKNISAIFNGQPVLVNPYLTAAANQATAAAGQVQQIITLGAGSYSIAQVQNNGYISSATRASLEGGLASLGYTSAQIAAMNMNQVKANFVTGAATLNTKAAETADTEVDTKQTGTGWTPIIGINISPDEKLNIGLKYEHKTKLKLTNDTKKSDAGLDFLKDGEEVDSDLPGFVSAGIGYKFTDKFQASVSFNEYLDKDVDWGENIYGQERKIDHNSWELALGFQYNISEEFAVSLGGMQTTTGVSEQYQSDFSYSISSATGGLGFQIKIFPELILDAGMMYTLYTDAEKKFPTYTETYDKKTIGFAIGLSYSITK